MSLVPHIQKVTPWMLFSLLALISVIYVLMIFIWLFIAVHFLNLSFPLDPTPVKCRIVKPVITQDVAQKVSHLFNPSLLRDCPDVATCFNNHCSVILKIAAPIKPAFIPLTKLTSWINESIRKSKRNCRKVERLWKSTNLEVHRLHLRKLWLEYFPNLISSYKKNSKVLFETINSCLSCDPHDTCVL